MFCTNCGSRIGNGDKFCTNCGAALPETTTASAETGQGPPYAYEPDRAAHVPNYLVQAIVVTIFCCLPVGIVSIVYAAQVNGLAAAGDIVGARRSSNLAKTWAWVTFMVGIVAWILWLAILLLSEVFTELSNELGTL